MKKGKGSHEPMRTYLESLTKKELIGMIVKYAPPSFFEIIEGRLANQQEAITMFRRIARKIDAVLDNDELLYNPGGFERELFKQLERLRGLWEKLPTEIGELILSLIRTVEQAFEDGYLYLERYDDEDDYFESEEVNTYIVQFVKSLPQPLQNEYLEQLEKVLGESGYSTFMSVGKQLL